MFRRKRLLLFTIWAIFISLLTTFSLILILPNQENARKTVTIEEKLYSELENLPPIYKKRQENITFDLHNFLTEEKHLNEEQLGKVWLEAKSWIKQSQVVNFNSPTLQNVIFGMKNAKIIKADLDSRGTQLKLLLTLQGGQEVVFKPRWYDINHVIEGPVYAGKDRFSSEILAFYLSFFFNKPLVPPSVARKISLENDIKPIATRRLMQTIIRRNNRTCFYGKCFFCKIQDPVCGDENSDLTGAVILNLKIKLGNNRSPWQRTYKNEKLAAWQIDQNYCDKIKQRLPRKRLYDLIDVSILDFLIQNGDRHHYETFLDSVIWLDNGKGLGNPFVHHLDILAPLYQCCMLRKETWKTLLSITGGTLGENLRSIKEVVDVVTEEHLKAVESRLMIIFAAIEYCKHKKK